MDSMVISNVVVVVRENLGFGEAFYQETGVALKNFR